MNLILEVFNCKVDKNEARCKMKVSVYLLLYQFGSHLSLVKLRESHILSFMIGWRPFYELESAGRLFSQVFWWKPFWMFIFKCLACLVQSCILFKIIDLVKFSYGNIPLFYLIFSNPLFGFCITVDIKRGRGLLYDDV